MSGMLRRGWRACVLLGLVLAAAPSQAATVRGPYNAEFIAGGDGLTKPLQGTPPKAGGPFTLYAWVRPSEIPAGPAIVAGIGGQNGVGQFLALDSTKPAVWSGRVTAAGSATFSAGSWHFIAAASDGAKVTLYVDGVSAAEGTVSPASAALGVQLAPRGVAGTVPFAGKIAGFGEEDRELSAAEMRALSAQRPDFDLVVFEAGSPVWPEQIHGMAGQVMPQDAWTLPKSNAPFSKPVAKPAYDGPALQPDGAGAWRLAKWRLVEAPKIAGDGARLSMSGYDASAWYEATVPGSVLTTLIDRGVYPDPDYGLNNMAIPESLNKQDYWYRCEFDAPAGAKDAHRLLTFKGINYAAEIWLNGKRIGGITGAFIRGRFDVTLAPGKNALAVKVSPPPHPGIAEEESLTAGVGENGGMEALDGPTFFADEGWDWIPSVRDRNTGLWQDVILSTSGALRIGDPQIVTTLPKSDNSEADIEITVPVRNLSHGALRAEVRAAFDGITVAQTRSFPAGESILKFSSARFPQLAVRHPDLWWPNGYGAPALHMAHLSVSQGRTLLDGRDVRFGMRQINYELSLLDGTGHLRRVEIDPSKARQLGQKITDGSHEGVRKIHDGWAASLAPGAENSPAVRDLPETSFTPYMVVKVNGVRIAARGGSWGTDDWRKRISRDRLEPFFRLHRDANINMIRNWVGQNTEDVFYDLADEYGLLVLNDFWASTQDYQMEPLDVPLFLANAADTIARYRNHPSIVEWFGRNEGIPQPPLNVGLETLVRDLDGTRYYSGSSNRVNLHDSGPYNYQEPVKYFTEFSKGFAVEVGTPSFPTLEAFQAAVPESDRWPISDVWAYHDWHITGNGAVKTFTDAMDAKFGPPVSLKDFERKAQMMNYETYRAIFEGMNAELWTRSSGRLLWMTQPAWPSTAWQILSHDYDTHAAYYGVKKAAEQVHVQMNMPDHRLAVINNTLAPVQASLHWRIAALDGRALGEGTDAVDAAANAFTDGRVLDLDPLLASGGAVLVELVLAANDGKELARNFYWVARDAAGSRKLSAMVPQAVTVSATSAHTGDEVEVLVELRNTGGAAALNGKLTLLDDSGARILPAYYADNYISLLPGEARSVRIDYPASASSRPARVALRGWNVAPVTVPVSPR